jgi:hypothetical protein
MMAYGSSRFNGLLDLLCSLLFVRCLSACSSLSRSYEISFLIEGSFYSKLVYVLPFFSNQAFLSGLKGMGHQLNAL